jgi:hypothetical protein
MCVSTYHVIKRCLQGLLPMPLRLHQMLRVHVFPRIKVLLQFLQVGV